MLMTVKDYYESRPPQIPPRANSTPFLNPNWRIRLTYRCVEDYKCLILRDLKADEHRPKKPDFTRRGFLKPVVREFAPLEKR